jgi:hypothetical protein
MRWSATEMRVVLWVIRKTFGWNRHTTEFTWYKIAADLHLDRAGVLRAGKRLLAGEVLTVESGTIGLTDAETHLVLGPGGGDVGHRMSNGSGENHHRERRPQSSLSRRAIDSSKDKQRYIQSAQASSQLTSTYPHPAGAARPVSGKYDDISAI